MRITWHVPMVVAVVSAAAALGFGIPRVNRLPLDERAAGTVAYHGWSGCPRLSNGIVELIFVPQVGRIMRYGRVGGPNMLWENPALAGKLADPASKDWTNFGGDKLWPAPQARWGWPPDPALDSAGYKVLESDGRHIQVRSESSAKHGVRFTRDIALQKEGTLVTIVNTMENTSREPVEWAIWEVAQADDPEWAEIPIDAGSPIKGGYSTFDDATVRNRGVSVAGSLGRGGATLRFQRDPVKGGKIGTDAPRQWARARIRGESFMVLGSAEKGALYPDGGCLQELYSSPDSLKYMELELLAPLRTLKPGERTSFTTRWRLESNPRESGKQ